MNATTPGAIAILLLTVAISLVGLYVKPRLIEASLFRPYRLVRDKRYYTLLSSGLVHGSIAHLLFNMVTFYFFGPPLERVVGTARFVTLYFSSMSITRHNVSYSQIAIERYSMKSTRSFADFWVLGTAALLLTACASQMQPAKRALDEIYDVVMATTPDATKYVPDQLAGVQRELGELQSSYDKKDYAGVLTRAPAVLADAKTMTADAAARKSDAAKALDTEWSEFAASLPPWITAVKDRVADDSNAKRAPKGIDLATAESTLADASDGWGRAQTAMASGETENAIATAKDVKSKIQSAAAALKLELPATGK